MNFLSRSSPTYSLLPTSSTDVLNQMAKHTSEIRSKSVSPLYADYDETKLESTDKEERSALASSSSSSSTSSTSSAPASCPRLSTTTWPSIPRRASLAPLLVFRRRTRAGITVGFGVVILLMVGTSLMVLVFSLRGSSAGYDRDYFETVFEVEEDRPPIHSPNATFIPPHSTSDHDDLLTPSMGGTLSIPSDSTHVLIPDQPLTPIQLLQPISTRLPHDLLEYYYTYGHLPPRTMPETSPKTPPIDIVYLWVNASSPYFEAEIANKQGVERIGGMRGKKKHWRDNGELRGAVRSAAESLQDALGVVHVVSADFKLDGGVADILTEPKEGDSQSTKIWRIGQIPEWLDWSSQDRWLKPTFGQKGLRWHFHSSLFRLPRDDDGSLPQDIADGQWSDELAWKDTALPTFNSFGIENRIGFVPGLSEQFILSNDDMFMLNPLSSSDFHNPLIGTVFRLDPSTELRVRPEVTPDLLSTPGEWGGLQHANSLLSRRFPKRSRMYMHHLPKSLTRSLVHEATVMFSNDLSIAATRGFRESQRGEGDVEMAWLVSHLQIERWREALLWSWVVAKIGGVEGVWGERARHEISAVFMDELINHGDVAVVRRRERTTLDDLQHVMAQAGWEMPKSTKYVFSSMDGHLPIQPNVPISQTSCTFQFSTCLPPSFMSSTTPYSAESIFKSLTFSKPQCGDCLIDALINASGDRGIHAFLPRRDAVYFPLGTGSDDEEAQGGKNLMWQREEPILPLSGSWEDGQFGLKHVVRLGQDLWVGSEIQEDGGVRLRDWCIKLLSRYAYTYAETPSRFSMIHNQVQLATTLVALNRAPEISLICLNDDQPDMGSPGLSQRFETWMKKTWGGKNQWIDWEKDDWEL